MAGSRHSIIIIGTGCPAERRVSTDRYRASWERGYAETGMQAYVVLGSRKLRICRLHQETYVVNPERARTMYNGLSNGQPFSSFTVSDMSYAFSTAIADLDRGLREPEDAGVQISADEWKALHVDERAPRTGRGWTTFMQRRLAFYAKWLGNIEGIGSLMPETISEALTSVVARGHDGTYLIRGNPETARARYLGGPADLQQWFAEPLEAYLRSQGFKIPVLVRPEVVEDVSAGVIQIDVE